MKNRLKNIFQNFICEGEYLDYSSLTSGHINDTYLINTDQRSYVLQKLNHHVFPNIPELMNNKVKIAKYLAEQENYHFSLLQFFPTNMGNHYHQDENGEYWSLINFIPDSKVLEKTENEDQAYEAGKAFAHFIAQLDGFNASGLYEIIPNFHKMSFRYLQFDEALINAAKDRISLAKDWIEQVQINRKKMHQLEDLYEQGEIPMRVTHNDTKLSNLLFNKENKAIAVIDWDTLMPGIVHYDFGDSVRSICSTATEDETNLEKVQFNKEFYESYKKGFLEELGSVLSKKEIELLPLAAETITFIMGLRFLTDFLNNDVYYKTKYPLHNLNRAANQLTLVKRIREVI